MKHWYVNRDHESLTLPLPEGSNITLLKGEAVKGDWFFRMFRAGLVVPIETMGKKFKPKKVLDPLRYVEPELPKSQSIEDARQEAIRDTALAKQATEVVITASPLTLIDEIPVPAPLPDANITDDQPVIVPAQVQIEKIEGKTKEEWSRWLVAAAESTINLTKLATLQEVGRSLGADVTRANNKMELIALLKLAAAGAASR